MKVKVFYEYAKYTPDEPYKPPQATVEDEVNEWLQANPDFMVLSSGVNMACGEDWTEFAVTLFYTEPMGWKLPEEQVNPC